MHFFLQPMRRYCRRVFFWVLIAIPVWLLSINVQAGSLSVYPLKLNFDDKTRFQALTVVNRGSREALVELSAHRWLLHNDQPAFKATGDLLTNPAVFKLQPQQRQLVRVAILPGTPITAEQTFRLYIDEIPAQRQKDKVEMKVRLSIPVFASSATTAPAELIATATTNGGDKLTLHTENKGGKHIRLVKLYDPNAPDSPLPLPNDLRQILLAQSSITQRLTIPGKVAAKNDAHALASLHLQYLTPPLTEPQTLVIPVDHAPVVSLDP